MPLYLIEQMRIQLTDVECNLSKQKKFSSSLTASKKRVSGDFEQQSMNVVVGHT
jgi:hypothetical protein